MTRTQFFCKSFEWIINKFSEWKKLNPLEWYKEITSFELDTEHSCLIIVRNNVHKIYVKVYPDTDLTPAFLKLSLTNYKTQKLKVFHLDIIFNRFILRHDYYYYYPDTTILVVKNNSSDFIPSIDFLINVGIIDKNTCDFNFKIKR